MSTVGLKQAQAIKDGNGFYPGDEHLPRVVCIVQYENQFNGAPAWKLYYKGQAVEPSGAMRNPFVWWRYHSVNT